MLALCFNNCRTGLVYSLFVVALIVCGEFMMGSCFVMWYFNIFEPRHEISNNVVCATSKVSD